jgi:sortase A
MRRATGRAILPVILCAVSLLPAVPAGQVSARGTGQSQIPTGRHVGSVSIPRLNLTSPIFSGATDAVYNRGIGHWPGSALPGQRGNMVLGGHRTADPRPFYDIQRMAKGDVITVMRGGRSHRYVVTRTMIVKPTSVWILNQTPDRTLTIFTCHPRGTTRQRYVVVARLST